MKKKIDKKQTTLETQKNNIPTGKKSKRKVDKDTLMNTPKELESGVKLMPFDDETLKTFSLKKMNFKDMTGSQKNTLIVICIFTLLIVLASALPTLAKMFGNLNFGDLKFFNPNTEEEPKEDEGAFATSLDYIVLGKNTTIRISDIKFDSFTKGSDYQLMYKYNATNKVEDVSSLKIYLEVYNNTKTLISRHAFSVENNVLEEKQSGLIKVKMTPNNFNKAHYVRLLVITDAQMEELPDESINPDDPSTPDDPSKPSTTNPNKSNEMVCSISKIDGSLRINKQMNVKFEKNEVSSYDVTYTITSLTDTVPKNYATYYRKMMRLFKDLMTSVGTTADINDNGTNATLKYEVIYSKYVNIEIDPEIYDTIDPEILEDLLSQKHPYDLEIKRKSNRASAKQQLESKEWNCD